ncbi:hypothetical protein MTO96_003988 [Rhipicephalus appendiculatus]
MRAEAAAYFLSPRATDEAMSFREGEVVASRPWGSSRAKPVQLVDNAADHVIGPAAAPVWMTNGGCGGYYHCRQCQMGAVNRRSPVVIAALPDP